MLLCGKNLDPDIWNCNFEGIFCNVFLKIRPVSRKTYSINDATNAKIDSVVSISLRLEPNDSPVTVKVFDGLGNSLVNCVFP